MNDGKLEVVKQEMARVKTDFFKISELKWTRMGVFKIVISMTMGKNPLKGMEYPS